MKPFRATASGNLARWIVIPWATLVLAATLVGLSARWPVGHQWVIVAAFLTVSIFGIVRSAMIGIWLTETGVLTRSWFSTQHVDAHEIERVEAQEYFGLISTWPFDKGIRMVVIARRERRPIAVRGAVAGVATTSRLIDEIREHLRVIANPT